MQSEKPTENLELLVEIIVKIYAPTILSIKKDFHVSQGPKHFFNLLAFSRSLLDNEKYGKHFKLVCKKLQDNGYFAHGEAILLCMLFDPVRKAEAVQKISELRQKEAKAQGFRKFTIPKINFSAKSVWDLVPVENFMSSPPLLQFYSMEQIENLDFGPDFQNLPSHSQAVERFVYLTSKAGENAVGFHGRHVWILNLMESVEKIPTDARKEDFIKLVKQKLSGD